MPEAPSILAITIATITEPASRDSGKPVRHLVGVGLLHIIERTTGSVSVRLGARTVPAEAGEAVLVDWLTEHLPPEASLVGWDLAGDIMPALLGAADEAPPDAARALVDVIEKMMSVGTTDLAEDHGGAAAPAFGAVCARVGIKVVEIAPDQLLAAWGLDRMDGVAEALGVNAVATWRLAASGSAAAHDRLATDLLSDWRRQARRAVGGHEFRHAAAGRLLKAVPEEEKGD